MSKDYLNAVITKEEMKDSDFEILENYYEEDEIDYIRAQMRVAESEYPRVDKYVADNMTVYMLFHSIDEESVKLAYITVTALIDNNIAVTAKIAQVGSTFSEEESDDVLKVLKELLQEEYSAMRQFLYGAKNVTIATSKNRAKRLRENLEAEDKAEDSKHKGCLKALLFQMIYVFPNYRRQHVFSTIIKILRKYYGEGVSMCMSTHSSGAVVDVAVSEKAGEAIGFTVSNDFLHISLDSDIKFAYYLDGSLVENARLLHTVQ